MGVESSILSFPSSNSFQCSPQIASSKSTHNAFNSPFGRKGSHNYQKTGKNIFFLSKNKGKFSSIEQNQSQIEYGGVGQRFKMPQEGKYKESVL